MADRSRDRRSGNTSYNKKIRIFEDRTEIMKMTMTEIVQKGILQITGREARTQKK